MVTRGLACWRLTGDESGYTVGMLSAVAELRAVEPHLLARRAWLSGETADALSYGSDELGRARTAVEGLEHGRSVDMRPPDWPVQTVTAT